MASVCTGQPGSGSGWVFANGIWSILKDPADKLDYGIAMQYWLEAGDSLDQTAQPFWTIPVGSNLVIAAQSVVLDPNNGPIAYVLLSGGVLGNMESAVCVWKTVNGLIKKQTLYFQMESN